MLLGFIAREDGDLRRMAKPALQEASNHPLPEGASSAGDQNPFAVDCHCPSPCRTVPYGVVSDASSRIIASHESGTMPVCARKRVPSRLRSICGTSRAVIVTLVPYASLS